MDGLSVDFVAGRGRRRRAVRALDGVGFEVREGEVLGIVGRSGSGKTTLALSVLGLLPGNARLVAERLQWDGADLLALPAERRRAMRGKDIAMVFQDPLSALHPAFPVVDQVAEALRAHRPDLDRAAARREAVAGLAAVGIPAPGARLGDYPHHWSGGMRQRAVIAMALAHRPRLLIADEPTTALDVTVQARIIELLRRTAPAAAERGARGATVLITHDFGLIAELADRVLVLDRGRVVERGAAERIFDRPEHPHTRALLAARPGLEARPLRDSRRAAPSRVRAVTGPVGAPALEVRDLSATYPPARRRSPAAAAVRSVSLQLHAGETLGIVGESGSGKTSLARALAGLLRATGEIRLAGRPIPTSTRRTRDDRRLLQLVFQNPYASLNPRRRIGDAIAEPMRIHRLCREGRDERVAELLDLVGLGASYASRLPAELSGGERQRVAIARSLACRPSVLVLDEPVTSLDTAVQARILDLLARLRAEFGMAQLLIAHDLRMVRDVADRVAVMREGRLVEVGPTTAVFEAPRHAETRRLLEAIPAAHPSDRPARGA